jgi:hypothetical protein
MRMLQPTNIWRTRSKKGVPLIIDLDSVDGFFGGRTLRMRR